MKEPSFASRESIYTCIPIYLYRHIAAHNRQIRSNEIKEARRVNNFFAKLHSRTHLPLSFSLESGFICFESALESSSGSEINGGRETSTRER